MAEEESPVIEEENQEPEAEQVPDDTTSLIEELKAAGVTNTQELQNKLKASAEVGNMAYKLGEERKEKAELLERMASLESMMKRSSEENYSTDYSERPIDLDSSIEKAVDKVFSKREQAQAQAQRNMMEAWNRIQNDKDFHLIKPVWDEKLKDPNFVYSVQSGQTNPVEAYQETLRDYYKGMIAKSAETIERLTGGKKVKTPVVEQGSSTAAEPEVKEEENKVLETLKEKLDRGGQLTEAEELAALQATFSQ